MVLVVNFVVLTMIITSVFGELINPLDEIPLLSNTYKDIFVGSQGGKPQLGTTSATCWARGGICVHIRNCPAGKNFDIGVSGCSTNFKVCCKLIHKLPPTVGIKRSGNDDEDSQDIIKSVNSQALIFQVL